MSRFSLVMTPRTLVAALLTMIVASVAASPGGAQTGTLTGVVTSAQNGQPLPAAQVYIQALDLGVLTQANGRYVLQNVPAGVHELAVQRIGYRTASASVMAGAPGVCR